MTDINKPIKGYTIPIGGAENKNTNPLILQKFVDICGGDKAAIAVIPTASKLSDTGPIYQELFLKLGAKQVEVLELKTRRDCENPQYNDILEAVDGVFMTGGDQLRLATIIGGSQITAIMRSRHRRGLHIAGTSAGAAFISEHMIVGGKNGITPRSDMVKLATGLGLSEEIIIDQHFRQRHRIGRLITALALNPTVVGLGIDEDTAAFIDPEDQFEVVGSGWVTVADPAQMQVSTMDSSKRNQHLSVTDLKIHMLASGDSYNIVSRQALLK